MARSYLAKISGSSHGAMRRKSMINIAVCRSDEDTAGSGKEPITLQKFKRDYGAPILSDCPSIPILNLEC
ncbi:hypothetical protein JW930_03165 [Candidatus Woesearchaeota archaeon]|nr:hypothetical protein [Candidatus Woesearchaeota archaeon]